MPNLIQLTDAGLYCEAGDFYIDPWKSVSKAVITHAHSDHARGGSASYLCHRQTTSLLQQRLGTHFYQSVEWGEVLNINGVRVSLHPAGHVAGSSQIRVEHQGEVWVASGDYKTVDDGLSGAFEPVRCHTFITESTFGLPIYQWLPQSEIYQQMANWVVQNAAEKVSSVFIAYSLGKAQRVADAIKQLGIPIFVHGAVWNMHQVLLKEGLPLPLVQKVTADTPVDALKGAIVIAPPGADGTSWLNRFKPYKTAVCSGWMQVRGNLRRNNADASFVLSDHADWKGLLEAITATQATRVLVTHGFQSVLSRYLNEKGILAAELKTLYGVEGE